jgi:dihydrofolate synthase/folylpolyglutamate synthase
MDTEKKYQETLDFLYSFIDYSLSRNFRNAAENFDLNRMHAFLGKLGNPHQKYPVIHLAGTKGKGSTSAMIASVLQAGGYQTGFYSSPHLLDYTERIQINNIPISQDALSEMVERIKPAIDQVEGLTTFEITTALAFMYYAEQEVDYAVFEVGLGGRLDATNVVDPIISVITSISYDHTQMLGNTLTKIAFEKGGIVKPGKPVVIAPQTSEAMIELERIAAEKESPLTQVGKDFLYASLAHSLYNQTILVWPKSEQDLVDFYIESGGRALWGPARLIIPLLGYHQVENAATAYTVIQRLKQQGLDIGEEEIKTGFLNVQWPARFEVIQQNPPIIVDSAHNRDSALKLRLTIDDYLADLPVILLFGASEDKDIEGMFSELLPRVREVVASESTHPRASKAENLVTLAHSHGVKASAVMPLDKALDKAIQLADGEAAVVATGSLFIAAGIKELFSQKEKVVAG